MRMTAMTAAQSRDIDGDDGHGGAMRDSRNPTFWDLEDSRS